MMIRSVYLRLITRTHSFVVLFCLMLVLAACGSYRQEVAGQASITATATPIDMSDCFANVEFHQRVQPASELPSILSQAESELGVRIPFPVLPQDVYDLNVAFVNSSNG